MIFLYFFCNHLPSCGCSLVNLLAESVLTDFCKKITLYGNAGYKSRKRIKFLYFLYMRKFFSILRSKSFWNGFLNGLSSPAYLFGYRSFEPSRKVLTLKTYGGLAEDWAKIGGDLRKVMAKYGETHPI